ncbi:hypothetical protein RHGRI_012313 [Rhododendron griersonianum]|uniref:Uncharacterized protein n=1 Tax=Rhododendron griersonianum TaxID=479676 RepID=A0AAV6KQ02_9ERIC|nr:hypothetical protein RHGRI_012313 [Rhododendron griersonianum]
MATSASHRKWLAITVERLTFEEFFNHPFLSQRQSNELLSPVRNAEEGSQEDNLPFSLDDVSNGPDRSPSFVRKPSMKFVSEMQVLKKVVPSQADPETDEVYAQIALLPEADQTKITNPDSPLPEPQSCNVHSFCKTLRLTQAHMVDFLFFGGMRMIACLHCSLFSSLSRAAAAMGKGRETSASAVAMGKGVGRETYACLRVAMDGVQSSAPLLWYVVNLGDSSDLQPCSKRSVRRMETEAWKRDIEFMQKCTEDMNRKFEEKEEAEKKDESDPMLNPVWQTEGIPELCFWTARDSTIYCLGTKRSGEPGYGRNFRDFDLLDLSEVVNIGPPMIRKRMNGKAVIARKNIYVFGGAKKVPWGEVLEIKGGGEGAEWKALNKPPMRIPPFDVFAFPLDDAADGIIVASGRKDGLFLYNIF